MSERDSIDKMTRGPNTVATLISDFRDLGISEGMTLLVHSSLSSLGWVCGGPVAVILALETILTGEGTLVMPTHSGDWSDPANWGNPPVPESWWETIRNEMPAYSPDLTPSRGMGCIPETFRKQTGVVRSGHPLTSFAAWGKHKEFIVRDASYDFSLNGQSPLGKVYDLDGSILLLGVDYPNNTSFHLAEYRADYKGKKRVPDGFPVLENGRRRWYQSEDILYYPDDFPEIGTAFEKEHGIRTGMIGAGKAKLIKQRELVDFSVSWMERNRNLPEN